MRQFLAFLSVGLVACLAAHAQKQPCATAGTNNDFLGIQTIRLWSGDAPQAKGKACEDTPTLTIFSPRNGSANGSAVVIFPGGSYLRLAGDLEGREIADWFTARGFRAFVLSYRLSSNGYLLPIPLLAALSGTQFVPGNPDAEDLIERASSRPDYLVLGYPWIGAITPDTSHLSYCKLYNLMDQCEALRLAYSPDLFVTKETPPTFWYHTFNDRTVPVEQGLRFYEALVKAGVPAEAHIFANGSHGSGLGKGDAALDQWPGLLENWLRAQGLLMVENVDGGSKP